MPNGHHRQLDPDWLSQLVIVFLCISAPALLRDDSAYFSYLNNVVAPRPLYFVNGFIYFIPELIAYALSGLPLSLQAILYRVAPMIMALLLYRETRRLLELDGDRTTASLLAVGSLLIVRVIEPNLWANLSFLIWSCFLWAAIHTIRLARTGAPYSWPAWIGVLTAAASFPLGLLFVPLWILQGWRSPRGVRTNQVRSLAAAVAALHLAFALAASGSPLRFENPGALLMAFLEHFRDRKLHNLVVVLSAGVLVIAAMRWLRRPRTDATSADAPTLAYLGIATVVVYALSDRFRQYDGGFEPQYVLPVLTFALIASAQLVLQWREARTRFMLVGASVGFAVAVAGAGFYTTLRGPLELALMKYRFLNVAEDFRRSCRGNDAMIFEDDGRSPVVLCRPLPLAVGFHPIRGVPPSVGVADPDHDDPAGIWVERPLF